MSFIFIKDLKRLLCKRLHCLTIFRKLTFLYSSCIKASDTSVHLHGGWWWSAHLLRKDPRDIKVPKESKGSRAVGGQQMLHRSCESFTCHCIAIYVTSTICIFRTVLEYCRRYEELGYGKSNKL